MSNLPGWDYLLDVMEKSAGPRLAQLDTIKKLLGSGKSLDDIGYMIDSKVGRLRNRLSIANPNQFERVLPTGEVSIGPSMDPIFKKTAR